MSDYSYLTPFLIASGINPGNISLPHYNTITFDSEQKLVSFINDINIEIGNVNRYKNLKPQVKALINQLQKIISSNGLNTVLTFNFSKY